MSKHQPWLQMSFYFITILICITVFISGIVITSAQPGNYCIPSYNYGTAGPNGNYANNDYINNVILNGSIGYYSISNSLNCCGPNIPPWNGGSAPFSAFAPYYESFSLGPGFNTVLEKCGSYMLQVQVGTRPANNFVAAWIDFNQDSVFDAGEKIMQTPGQGLSNLGWENSAFSVPASAAIGVTTLRVRAVYNQPNIDPCHTEDYGETEDYPIIILPCCNLLPGWTVWIGALSDDWDVNENWCGGVPTSAKNAAIISDIEPAPGIQPPLRQPVIKSGVFASTKKLWIDGPTTLTIDAAFNSSLSVFDSLMIKTSDSHLNVISTINSYPINIKTHWLNNGTFSAGNSRVTFNGNAHQYISGDSSTTFNELAVANTGSNVTLLKNTFVSDSIILIEGNLKLNQHELTLFNGNPGSVKRSNGLLISEDSLPPYGTFNWKIGNQNGNYIIPFGNDSGHYIPFSYEKTSGFSDLSVSTYRTSILNTPWPLGVTNLNGLNSQSGNGLNMIDRFWLITDNGSNVTSGLDFGFTASEASGCQLPFISQRWDGLQWQPPLAGQTSSNYFNNTPSVQQVSGVWAITCNGQPLIVNENVQVPGVLILSSRYANDHLVVNASIMNPGIYFLRVTDISGRIVYVHELNFLQKGEHSLKINSKLARGVYSVVLFSGEATAVKPFAVIE